MFNFFKRKKKNEIEDLYRKGAEAAVSTFGEIKFAERKPEDLEVLKERMDKPMTIEEVLEEHKIQLTNWAKSYLNLATGEENDIALLEDLERDINRDFLPQLSRYRECEHITLEQYNDFQAWILATLQTFRADLGKIELKRKEEDPIITLLRNLNLTDRQKKAVKDYLKSDGFCGNCENCRDL